MPQRPAVVNWLIEDGEYFVVVSATNAFDDNLRPLGPCNVRITVDNAEALGHSLLDRVEALRELERPGITTATADDVYQRVVNRLKENGHTL